MSARRIGLIHFGRFPDLRSSNWAEALAAGGHSVTVLARQLPPPGRAPHPLAAQLEQRRTGYAGRLELREVRPGPPTVATMPYHFNPVWRRAIKGLVDEGMDLLVVRDIPLLLAATAAAQRRGIPVLLDVAENYPAVLREWRRWEGRSKAVVNGVLRNAHLADALERRAVRAADRVAVVVPEHLERIVAMRRDGAGVDVVENTPMVDDLPYDDTPAPATNGALTVTHTGEVHFYRGIDTVIAAARLLRDRRGPQVRWRLAGTGAMEAALRAQAAELGVDDAVQFLGWQEEPFREVAAADVGVIPPHASAHYAVTMPSKLYEFMGMGKPVVVSDVAPMRRVVEDTGCGLAFRAGDPASLADAVTRLADDSDLRRRLGTAGRAAVLDRFNWKVDGDRLLEIVDELPRTR